MKAVLQYRASPVFLSLIETLRPAWLDVVVIDEDDKAAFAAEMADADVLLHVLEPVTAAVIEGAARLRLVQKLGIGVNTIDVEVAAARGVSVSNMPGVNTSAVAELALGLMLAVLRRVPSFDSATRAGRGWHVDPGTVDATGEVDGRTVGLVGYGAIARRLAPVLQALGANVVCTSRTPPSDLQSGVEWTDLDTLLARADVVSLHVPLMPDTERMLDATAIARMKPGAILVNTARGGLVDEAALVEALRSGHLRGAGLDVFASEPVEPDDPLLSLDNVVLSPHLAWLTPETLGRSIRIAYENCRRLHDGELLLHVVAGPKLI